MTNPIEFENNYEISDIKLKLISLNVIDYLSKKYNIQISNIVFNDYNEFDFSMNMKNFEFYIDIPLYIDFKEQFLLKYLNLNKFIESLNIKDYDNLNYARYVFLILCQIGYCIEYNKLLNLIGLNSYKLMDLITTIERLSYLSLIEYLDENFIRFLDPVNLNGIVFAYQNFYEVWNMLKDRNLI